MNQVATGGITAGITRFYSIAAEKEDLGGYLHSTICFLFLILIVSIAIGLVMLTSLNIIGHSKWIPMVIASLIFSLFSSYNNIIRGIQNAARQRVIVALIDILDAWLKVGITFCVIYWLKISSTAVVIGYSIGSFFILFPQLLCLRITIPKAKLHLPVGNQQWFRQIWSFSLPFMSFGIFTFFQQASDRWALQIFASTTDVGRYAVLFQLGYAPMTIAIGLIMSLIGPIIYQRSGDASNHARNLKVHVICWHIAFIALFSTFCIFVITFFMHEWLFRLLVGNEYLSSSRYLPWIVLASGIFAAGQILSLKMMSELKTSSLTSVKIITAIIGISCNVVGAAYAGIHGVVSALVVFSIVYFLWMAIIGRRTPEVLSKSSLAA